MSVYALADFHLSFGLPNKSMEVFGKAWEGWTDQILENCRKIISNNDLLLIAGDISWATNMEQATFDLNWIAQLPGTKLLLKGNHDYWWGSLAKVEKALPPSVHVIQNNSFTFNDVTIGGVRLWDSPEYHFGSVTEIKENPLAQKDTRNREEVLKENEKIFQRDLLRLEMSLATLDPKAKYRIAMTHYPPIGLDLKPSRASIILESYQIDHCIFGHLHNLNTHAPLFGKSGKTTYHLTSCDYLQFVPKKIL